MITLEKVITVNGRLENRGDWDYMPYDVEVINNPFPGPGQAPEDWDYQITYETRYANPLPEGAIEEELEIFFDRQGTLRLVDQASELEMVTRLASAKTELDELLIDINLGMASEEEIIRARELRTFIKDNS